MHCLASTLLDANNGSVLHALRALDGEYRRTLDRHLAFLRRSGHFSIWHDRVLMPGDEWERRIAEQLELADIVLLLISPDFASSEYCWGVEVKRALERRQQGDAIVVPILIRPAAGWDETPLGRLQALPSDGRPVSSWHDSDEAFHNIAEGLRDLIRQPTRNTTYVGPDWREWLLCVEGVPGDYPSSRREMIAARLRKAANSEDLDIIEVLAGSAELLLRSTQSVLDTLTRLNSERKLDDLIGARVREIQRDLGSVLRVESRVVDGEYRSTIHYLPELFGGRALESGFPPLVGGITFPLNDPLKIGFELLTDATQEMPTEAEQLELQGRLGRYLNTFLVLSGDQINVTLSPTEDYGGLPELLRHTELRRDMLAQDVVLKHYAAAQLHPSTPHGNSFWNRVNALTSGNRNFESCFRVWIVPDDVTAREATVGDQGQVTIEKLGLKVLCEQDYETLCRYRESQCTGREAPRSPKLDAEVIALFKNLIVPEIQKEVSIGPRFGLLRQILSILVVAKWIMKSQLGDALKQAGFIGSNAPDKYGLNTVDDRVLHAMKRAYMQMFSAGIWQHTIMQISPESGFVEKRLYIAGGIAFGHEGIAEPAQNRIL